MLEIIGTYKRIVNWTRQATGSKSKVSEHKYYEAKKELLR